MYATTAFNLHGNSAEKNPQHAARRLAAQAYGKARKNESRLFAGLRRSAARLSELADVERKARIVSRHYAGLRLVAIDRITGSEGRAQDFDADFRPLQQHSFSRWASVAAAHLQGKGLPPVELVQVGDTYYVRDGHHRVSVAKHLGQREIEAEVTVWQVA